jgi:hypothetical protein
VPGFGTPFSFCAPADPRAGIIPAVPGRFRPILASLGVCFLAAGSAARGETASFRSPFAGTPLLAGTTVTVEWELPEAPDAQTREMELLLSLDGGRTFEIRVTGEIEPEETRISWRVPSLPSLHARLALRTGSGERDSETIRIMSEEFEIRQGADAAGEAFLRVDGERRTRDALVLPETEPVPQGSIQAHPELFARAAPEPAGAPPRTDPTEAPPATAGKALVFEAPPPSVSGAPVSPSRCTPLPLRE